MIRIRFDDDENPALTRRSVGMGILGFSTMFACAVWLVSVLKFGNVKLSRHIEQQCLEHAEELEDLAEGYELEIARCKESLKEAKGVQKSQEEDRLRKLVIELEQCRSDAREARKNAADVKERRESSLKRR